MNIPQRIRLLKRLRILIIIIMVLVWADTDMSEIGNAIVLGLVSAFTLSLVLFMTVTIIRLEQFDDFI